MPTYSFFCDNCNRSFEIFLYIKDYKENVQCVHCNKKRTRREYIKDVLTQNTSVRKSDSELKTIGDLALRNTDRMSQDEKSHLYHKHNAYKEKPSEKELPKGMSRIKKPPKTKWT